MEASLAAWSLGRILSLDLPKFAAAVLAAGTDSPSLRWLAGWSPTDATSPNELLMRVVDELGLEMPDSKSAARRYAVCVSRLILSAEIRPADGAKEIWRASLAVKDPSFHDLDTFIYAASEYDDRPMERPLFDKAILDEARRWMRMR